MEDRVISQQEIAPDATARRVGPAREPTKAVPPFPELLAQVREERGLAKADLAKRANYDPSTITRFEQGSRDPDREAILRLADAMVLPLAERDRLLASAGFRSVLWDDSQMIELLELLNDARVPEPTKREVRSVIQMAISHCKLARLAG